MCNYTVVVEKVENGYILDCGLDNKFIFLSFEELIVKLDEYFKNLKTPSEMKKIQQEAFERTVTKTNKVLA